MVSALGIIMAEFADDFCALCVANGAGEGFLTVSSAGCSCGNLAVIPFVTFCRSHSEIAEKLVAGFTIVEGKSFLGAGFRLIVGFNRMCSNCAGFYYVAVVAA